MCYLSFGCLVCSAAISNPKDAECSQPHRVPIYGTTLALMFALDHNTHKRMQAQMTRSCHFLPFLSSCVEENTQVFERRTGTPKTTVLHKQMTTRTSLRTFPLCQQGAGHIPPAFCHFVFQQRPTTCFRCLDLRFD